MVVDYNAGGMLRDGWVTSQVDRLLERCRAAGAEDGGRPARATFSQVEAPQARRRRETALAVTEAGQGPPPSDSFASYHAFIRARIRTLPPARPGYGGRNGASRESGNSPAPWSTAPWARGTGRAGCGHRAAARLDPGSPGHAGGRVPGLGRGGRPV